MPEQKTTAVYVNRWGQAVIRQERGPMDDDDIWVIIDHAHIPGVIKALRDIADAPVARDTLPEDLSPPKRSMAAPAAAGVTNLNDHVAERARGEHSRATE